MTSKEDIEILFTNIVATIGQNFKAGTLALELPLISDIEESQSSPFYYYDTDYNSDREGSCKKIANSPLYILGLCLVFVGFL